MTINPVPDLELGTIPLDKPGAVTSLEMIMGNIPVHFQVKPKSGESWSPEFVDSYQDEQMIHVGWKSTNLLTANSSQNSIVTKGIISCYAAIGISPSKDIALAHYY